MEKHTVAAVDIAKVVFEIAQSDEPGRVRMTRRLPRSGFLPFFAQLPAAIVVMEACGSAHYWARRFQELGHQVVLLPPHQVRPYVTRNKTDRTDAKGILEAYRNADIRPVPVKSIPSRSWSPCTERTKMTQLPIEAIAEQTPTVDLLWSIPGIGLLIATALVAFVGDIRRFPSARHFASYLGLTPTEYSSGMKRRRGRISKRGDAYSECS